MIRISKKWGILLGLCTCSVLGFIAAVVGIGLGGLHDHLGHADVGVVLGAHVNEDGTPSRRLRGRLEKAVQLYREGMFPLVIVSGGIEKGGPYQAFVMKAYLTERGVPASRIIVDQIGDNTFLTAQHSAEIMRRRSLASAFIVSQYFHLPRCQLAFRRFGVSSLYWAHADFFERADAFSLAREVPALIFYATRSYHQAGGSAGDPLQS